jgi:aspartate racemase
MIDAARRLGNGGAEFFLICSNARHRMADAIAAADSAPAYRRSDGRAHCRAFDAARRLLGTAFTMELDFYKGRLADRFGLDVLIPDAADRALAHRTIYGVAPLIARRAQGIVLGCTEIMLLVRGEDSAVPLFDTTSLTSKRPSSAPCPPNHCPIVLANGRRRQAVRKTAMKACYPAG